MKTLVADLGSRRLHDCAGNSLTLRIASRLSRRQCRRVSSHSLDGTGPLARLADFPCAVVSDVGCIQRVPCGHAASTFSRPAISFAVFEIVRSKFRIATSICPGSSASSVRKASLIPPAMDRPYHQIRKVPCSSTTIGLQPLNPTNWRDLGHPRGRLAV
jgi:hypothetical protein